jgi:Ca-activated chloride channel family protein
LQKAFAVLCFLLVATAGQASPSSAFRDYQSGDFKGAFDEYNRLSQKNTNDYRLHYDAGAAAYRAKQLEKAEKQFNATLASPGVIPDVQTQEHTYYNLGNTEYYLGASLSEPDKKEALWQQAMDSYTNALRLNTNDADAKNNLAFVKHKLEELKQQQQQHNKQQPKDLEPSDAAKKAKAHADEAVKQRQYKQALDIMEDSLNSDPTTQYYADYIKRLQEINGVAVAPNP